MALVSMVKVLAGKLEEEGDGNHHAADEIGDGGGDGGPEVGAELLGGDGDEDRPVAAAETEEGADGVECGRARAGRQEVGGDAGHGQSDEDKNTTFLRLLRNWLRRPLARSPKMSPR